MTGRERVARDRARDKFAEAVKVGGRDGGRMTAEELRNVPPGATRRAVDAEGGETWQAQPRVGRKRIFLGGNFTSKHDAERAVESMRQWARWILRNTDHYPA